MMKKKIGFNFKGFDSPLMKRFNSFKSIYSVFDYVYLCEQNPVMWKRTLMYNVNCALCYMFCKYCKVHRGNEKKPNNKSPISDNQTN